MKSVSQKVDEEVEEEIINSSKEDKIEKDEKINKENKSNTPIIFNTNNYQLIQLSKIWRVQQVEIYRKSSKIGPGVFLILQRGPILEDLR